MKVDFKPEPNVEFYKIPYEDKVREKARQARMQDERKAEKLAKRREEKKQKREEKQKKAEERVKMKANRKRVGKHQQILAEWDDLAKEERLHKKLKRGKISQAEYDRQMYGDKNDKKSANAANDLDDLSDIEQRIQFFTFSSRSFIRHELHQVNSEKDIKIEVIL